MSSWLLWSCLISAASVGTMAPPQRLALLLAGILSLMHPASSIICEPGLRFQHPSDPSSFHLCGKDSNPYSFTCSDPLHFNPKTKACDWPANVIDALVQTALAGGGEEKNAENSKTENKTENTPNSSEIVHTGESLSPSFLNKSDEMVESAALSSSKFNHPVEQTVSDTAGYVEDEVEKKSKRQVFKDTSDGHDGKLISYGDYLSPKNHESEEGKLEQEYRDGYGKEASSDSSRNDTSGTNPLQYQAYPGTIRFIPTSNKAEDSFGYSQDTTDVDVEGSDMSKVSTEVGGSVSTGDTPGDALILQQRR